MTLRDVFEVASAVIISLGGGGALVASLSGRLGKLWADRLMARERADHEEKLERFRSELSRKNESALSELQAAIEVAKTKHLSGHDDKIRIYRQVVDVVSEMLGDLDAHAAGRFPADQAGTRVDQFNRGRMRAYGYLAMLAPQAVMDGADALFDDLLQVVNGALPYEWRRVRDNILRLLNAVRVDIGYDARPIEYRGVL